MENSREDSPSQDVPPLRSKLISSFEFIDHHPFYILGLFILVGVFMVFLINWGLPPTIQSGSSDTWWVIVQNLIHGKGYSLCVTRYFPFCGPTNQITAMREPAPVLLFALVALVSRESLWAATVVEFVIYILTLLGLYFLTRTWGSLRASLLAAFFWAIFTPPLELVPQVSGDLLSTLFVTLGILFVFRARLTRHKKDWFFAGISLGLAGMSRSAALGVAVVVIVGQVLDDLRFNVQNFQKSLKPFVILSSSVILVMTPWVIRNKIELGSPIIGSSLVGYNLYRQSHILNAEDYLRYVGGVEAGNEVLDLVQRPNSHLNGSENEAQMDVVYRTEALKFIRENPEKYILASAYRFFPLFFNWRVKEGDGNKTLKHDYAIMLMQAVLLILAGSAVHRNFIRTWPLWGSILIFSLSYMLVESQLRFLIPVEPLILSLSAVEGERLFKKLLLKWAPFQPI